MFASLRNLFGSSPEPVRSAVPDGTRYYVIGDVHGRRDLFDALIAAVERDDRESVPADTTVVLLGDLVDRGPDSAGVVGRAIEWQDRRNVVLLAGNHEEMFLDSFETEGVLRHFLRHGGRQTLLSYGLPREEYDAATVEEIQALMPRIVPQSHRDFLSGASNHLVAGDYLFVHAGIFPDIPLAEQQEHHLRWIREPFLDHSDRHEYMVVHGHTITEDVDLRTNRLGIDTGAYRTGRLTALVLEGEQRRLIQAVQAEHGITIEHRDFAA